MLGWEVEGALPRAQPGLGRISRFPPTPRFNGLFFSFRTLFPSSSCQLVKRGIVLRDLRIWALHRDARWSGTGAWWRFPGRAHENRALSRVAPSNHPGWARSLFYIFRVNRLLLIPPRYPLCKLFVLLAGFAVKVDCWQEASGRR